MKKKLTALALTGVLSLSLALSGCGGPPTISADLTDGITGSGAPAAYETAKEVPAADVAAMTDFGLKLLKQCAGEENVLLSPASVLSALGMTANGAKGETLTQFETAFGLSMDELNQALSVCLPAEDESGVLSRANAIWFNSGRGLALSHDFLQTNADWYGAGLYSSPFDSGTCDEINRWVSDHTDGMIPKILDQVSEDALMYLVNALAFDGEWASPYTAEDTWSGTFTREDGTAQQVDFMHGEEYAYLDGEKVTGFIKSYTGGKYAFAALLPDRGVSVEEALDSLTGESLTDLLRNVYGEEVITALPKFTSDYDVGLEQVLPALGITDAFDAGLADFSGMGTTEDGGPNLFISRVLHKTHIEVDELGTKAAAATVVEMTEGAAAELEPPKEVILDRPFLYTIFDRESGLPLFLGTAMSIET